jgi:hypothetical protein
VLAAVLIALALASATFAALSLRLSSPVTTALAGYVMLVGNLGLVTWVLSPVHAVTRTGLLVAEVVLLAAGFAAWWLRGRPRLELGGARAAAVAISRDPVTLLFLAVVAVALVYELVVAVTAAPNNYDSLSYHLSRAAAWKQYGGVHWIANAPTDRLNEFQPLAEQQILFLLVAAGNGSLVALPQFVAELAILVAVFGASRRLGFDQRTSACSAALLATFTLVALEATTAQNDLVATALPAAAVCLLLSGGSTEAVLAGIALGFGLGAKLTTLLVWPVIAWLAWLGGRRVFVRAATGAVAGFVTVGIWSFVLNLIHTGHLLGRGGGRTDQSVSPSAVTAAHMFLRVVYRLLDLSLISNTRIWELAALGGLAAVVLVLRDRNRRAALVAIPLVMPAVVLGAAPAVAWFAHVVHLPVRDPIFGFSLNRGADEDHSSFGPLGALGLIGIPIFVAVAHRADRRKLALAVAMPSYLILLGFYAKYNIWILRFMIVPAVLTAPLFGYLLRRRAVAAAALVVAALTINFALVDNTTKPLHGAVGRPWNLDQQRALQESPAQPGGDRAAGALTAYERIVPSGSCVGAVLDPDEWSYMLWGPHLANRVYFLPSSTAVETADAENLRYVVISTGANAPIADVFRKAGWRIEPLGSWWNLAVARGHPSGCP